MLEPVKLIGTTDGSGDATVTSESTYNGLLHSVQWIDGDLADGVDAVLSVVNTDAGVDFTLLTLTNANSDAMYHPRHQIDTEAGAGVTYDGTNEVYEMAPIVGKLKLVISAGGDTKTGGAVVYIKC
jgi:hypothetical protein